MKTALHSLLLMMGALIPAAAAPAATISLSLNVFPTDVANPNGGGTFRVVAKTDAPMGIASISTYLLNVNLAGIGVEPDINSITQPGGAPYATISSGAVNILYGQDTSSNPPLTGVGRPPLGDGPDPFGDPAWDQATRIFFGTYNALAPSFAANSGSTATTGNVVVSTQPGVAAMAATFELVVRVAVPEPAAMSIALGAVFGLPLLRARRRFA